MGTGRKVRSDKKVDCKPTITTSLKECIYRISYITNTPVKDVTEKICLSGVKSKKIIELLSNHFKRDLKIRNTFYMGDLETESLQRMNKTEKTTRITTRFKQHEYEQIKRLAFALDVSPTRATSLLLEKTILYTNIVDHLSREYLKGNINDSKLRELRKIIKFINENNNLEDKLSWSNLLSYFYDELKDGATSINKAITNWIEKSK